MTDPKLTPSLPLLSVSLDAQPDPELLALPDPPRRERTLTVALMAITALLAALLVVTLRGEVRYAFSPGTPLDVGDLATAPLGAETSHRYVRGTGTLATAGAIRYGRAAEGDSFRLAPVLGRDDVWVEIRVPEGFEGPRFIPPGSFAGRLVPLGEAGVRHAGLASAVRRETGRSIPEGAWLLVDGSSPRQSRWAVALALLLAGFVVWNVVGVVRVLRPVR